MKAIKHLQPWMPLVLIVIAQCTVFMIYGMHKPDLFVDEWYSFSLANAQFPTVGAHSVEHLFSQRLPPEFWNSLLTVKPQDIFEFSHVWANQAADVHPPFYYALLHVLCGSLALLSPEFSIMPALLLNLVFMAGTDVVLFRIACRLLPSRLALFAVLLYAFSLGCFTTALFLRMYMMLTFFVLLAIYLLLCLEASDGSRPALSRRQVLLIIVLCCVHVLGFLTQYFYSVFIFFASLTTVLFLYIGHRLRLIAALLTGSLLSVFTSYVIFHRFINHIFGGGATVVRKPSTISPRADSPRDFLNFSERSSI